MAVMLSLVLLACVGGTPRGERGPAVGDGTAEDTAADSSDDPGAGDLGDGGGPDTGPDDTGPDDTGPDDTGSAADLGCPTGMAGVPAEAPAWCIDAYEASVVDGVPRSEPGVLPSIGRTVVDAAALCAASPVLDAAGEVLAERRLATLEEWRDAGDNRLGEGGDSFPWGDDWVDGRCAAPDEEGNRTVTELQPTGSFPDCVSDAGVYDQVGNAFEWVDVGVEIDTEAFLAARAAEGMSVELAEDGTIVVTGTEAGSLLLSIAGAHGEVSADAEGRLVLWDADLSGLPVDNWGYLQANAEVPAGDVVAADLLPVQVAIDDLDDAGRPFVRHRAGEDGQPVPGKAGCAWYVGEASGCRLTMVTVGHTWDFAGTISFRCVSPLVPVDALP